MELVTLAEGHRKLAAADLLASEKITYGFDGILLIGEAFIGVAVVKV